VLLIQDNKKLAEALRIESPQKRFRAVQELCSGQNTCNGGYELDETVLKDGEQAMVYDPCLRVQSECAN